MHNLTKLKKLKQDIFFKKLELIFIINWKIIFSQN